MKVQIEVELKIPEVPNFIILANEPPGLMQDGFKEADKISIADLTDKQLEEIANHWKLSLLKKAREIRNIPMLRD